MRNMLEPLETLVALAEAGTMTRAALKLRISQSAVTKRIASLEAELCVNLVERVGRNVRLTQAGQALIERTQPLLFELREALSGQREGARGQISLGVSESVLTSWGPRVLSRVRAELPNLTLTLHTHRSPVAVDRVRAGELTLGLVAGTFREGTQLWCDRVLDEPMVLVGDHGPPALSRRQPLRVTTIEGHSETFRALGPQLKQLARGGLVLEVERELQSFAAIVQLARAGFGTALVPAPLALALGVPSSQLRPLPKPGLTRPISLIGSKSAMTRPAVAAFRAALLRAVQADSVGSKSADREGLGP